MLDIKFVRTNPDAVKENIKKKFQDEKISMVDEVIEFDAKYRAAIPAVTSCVHSATRSPRRSAV